MLLDVDGTLIGDIAPQLCEYELLQLFDKRRVNAFKEDVVTYLREGGVLRPHLQTLLSTLRRSSPATELFVYTASSDEWAKVIVPCIEKAAGVRFNRPLFTRKHCVLPSDARHDMDFKKSIAKVAPAIQRALVAKGALPPATRVDDVRRGCILVDNNPVVLLDPATEGHRLVKVPTYDAALYYDVTTRVPLDVQRRDPHEVRGVLTRFGLYTSDRSSTSDLSSFNAHYFATLASLSIREQDRRASEPPERLWTAISDTLFSARRHPEAAAFSPQLVRAMNEAVRGRHGGGGK